MTPLISEEILRSDLEDTCREAFCTSLLLTGSVSSTQSIVMEAIELWTPEDTVEGALIRYVIDKSIETREPVDIEPASQIVSEALRPVLRLGGARRHCFVLRILATLSKQACCCILGLTAYEVESYTAAALALLADLWQQERFPTMPAVRDSSCVEWIEGRTGRGHGFKKERKRRQTNERKSGW